MADTESESNNEFRPRIRPIEIVTSTVGDGSVEFNVPDSWILKERTFDCVRYEITSLEGAEAEFTVESYEDAAAIGADDLIDYLKYPGAGPGAREELEEMAESVRRDDGGINWPRLTWRSDAEKNDPETKVAVADAVLWRRLSVVQDKFIHVFTVSLVLPFDADEAEAGILKTLLLHFADSAFFSSEPTRLDQVSHVGDLAPHWFDGLAAMRLPSDWKRNTDTDTNELFPLYAHDDPHEDENWTFWYQIMLLRSDREYPDPHSRLVLRYLTEGKENGPERGKWDESAYFLDTENPALGYERRVKTEIERGTKLRRINWNVLKGAPGLVVLIAAHWVVVDSVFDRPDIRELTDMLEREVPNSLILAELAADLYR